MLVENSKEPRTILLVAKFARKGLRNVSSMAKTLLAQGLVFVRVSKLSAYEYQNLEKSETYNYKCVCGFHFSTSNGDLFDTILEDHEDCELR